MIGYTRPVAVGFVTQDTKTNIITFLQLFKTCHPEENLNRTKIIFVDKDQKDIRNRPGACELNYIALLVPRSKIFQNLHCRMG